jgi:hypothetical protein
VPCSIETQCYCFSQASQAEFYKPGRISQAQTSALAVWRGLEPSRIRFPNYRMPIKSKFCMCCTTNKQNTQTHAAQHVQRGAHVNMRSCVQTTTNIQDSHLVNPSQCNSCNFLYFLRSSFCVHYSTKSDQSCKSPIGNQN